MVYYNKDNFRLEAGAGLRTFVCSLLQRPGGALAYDAHLTVHSKTPQFASMIPDSAFCQAQMHFNLA